MDGNKTLILWAYMFTSQLLIAAAAVFFYPPNGDLGSVISLDAAGGLILPLYLVAAFSIIFGYAIRRFLAGSNPFMILLLKMAMFEFATICGFILAVVAKNSMIAAPLFALGIVNIGLVYPLKGSVA